MKIKVLMIVPNLRVANGVASYAMNYFRNLDRRKVQMDFALYTDVASPYYKEIKDAGSKCYILPGIKNLIAHTKECNRILNEGNYDIIHDNTLLLSIPLMRSAERHTVPVRILHSHSAGLGETSIKAKRNELFLPVLKSFATDYAACSDAAAKALFGDGDFIFIPNIVSEDSLSYSPEKRAEMRMKMGVTNKPIIASVGRMAFPKNPFFALEVIKEAVHMLPQIEYWWIGSGALDAEFRTRISEMELDNNIRFLGSKETEELRDLYQAMDVFFMPSRFEGLGMAALEAQATGLPCIVSDAVPSIVDYTGNVKRISLNTSAKDWAKVLVSHANNLKERRSYLEELKSSDYAETGAGDRLLAQYRQLLNRHGRHTD